MMQYKGYYWTLLSPLIKKSIAKRYSKALAEQSIRDGKQEYRGLLARADDIGPGNPMEENAYFAYVFVGAWLGSKKEIPAAGMADVMTDVLHMMKPFFGVVNLNTKRGSTMWYRKMKKYEAWAKDKMDKYPTTWKVGFDEGLHQDGSYYCFTQCPICSFCQKEGIPEIMGPLCATDGIMFAMQHGVLHREFTIAGGDPMCDYWIVGDQLKNPK